METPISQPAEQTESEVATAIETVAEPVFSPTQQSIQKGRWIFTQILDFLGQFFNNLGSFFSTYRQFLIALALVLGALIALRMVVAVMNTLNNIPLIAPTFKLVGIGYSIWFVNRYFLKASTRQELAQALQNLLGNISA